jgi:phenylacetate-CoA ligase
VSSDIRCLKDLEILPVLTKEIIRNNFDDLIAQNINREELIKNSTGGSTGEPLHFFQDRKFDSWADAARLRGWYDIAGCNSADKCAVVWGAMHEVKEDFTLRERTRDFFKHGHIYLNAFNLSDERKEHFLKLCNITRPKLLRGYTTALKDLAIYVQSTGKSFPKIKGVILCAETVDEQTQQFIEKVFQAPSYNTYGGRELSLIGMECSAKNGLHEISENNYVEFEPIDLAGYGNAGNLLITNLNNFGMPFIRYRIGDIGIPGKKESCECGRGLPLIKRVIGRTTEVLVFQDSTRVAGEMFIHLMKEFPINEYQFVQTSPTRVILRYKKAGHIDDELKKTITNQYKAYLPEGVVFDFEEVDFFEKTITGKFRFVLKDFPTKDDG